MAGKETQPRIGRRDFVKFSAVVLAGTVLALESMARPERAEADGDVVKFTLEDLLGNRVIDPGTYAELTRSRPEEPFNGANRIRYSENGTAMTIVWADPPVAINLTKIQQAGLGVPVFNGGNDNTQTSQYGGQNGDVVGIFSTMTGQDMDFPPKGGTLRIAKDDQAADRIRRHIASGVKKDAQRDPRANYVEVGFVDAGTNTTTPAGAPANPRFIPAPANPNFGNSGSVSQPNGGSGGFIPAPANPRFN